MFHVKDFSDARKDPKDAPKISFRLIDQLPPHLAATSRLS